MNTAIAITAIIAVLLLANSGITALRDVAKAKHQPGIARVRALHRKASHGDTCVYCAHGQRLGYDTTWPCDTIRALDGDHTSKENEA